MLHKAYNPKKTGSCTTRQKTMLAQNYSRAPELYTSKKTVSFKAVDSARNRCLDKRELFDNSCNDHRLFTFSFASLFPFSPHLFLLMIFYLLGGKKIHNLALALKQKKKKQGQKIRGNYNHNVPSPQNRNREVLGCKKSCITGLLNDDDKLVFSLTQELQ